MSALSRTSGGSPWAYIADCHSTPVSGVPSGLASINTNRASVDVEHVVSPVLTSRHDRLPDRDTLPGEQVQQPTVLHHPTSSMQLRIDQRPRTLFSMQLLTPCHPKRLSLGPLHPADEFFDVDLSYQGGEPSLRMQVEWLQFGGGGGNEQELDPDIADADTAASEEAERIAKNGRQCRSKIVVAALRHYLTYGHPRRRRSGGGGPGTSGAAAGPW